MFSKQQQLIIKTAFSMFSGSTPVTGYSIAQRLNLHVSTVYNQINKIKNMEVA